MRLAGGSAALAGLVNAGVSRAEPQAEDATWIANHLDTRLLGADGQPVVGLPRWTRMRILSAQPRGLLEVWVPRFDLVGRVSADAVGPVVMPSADDLAAEKLDGPSLYAGGVGLPGRVVGGRTADVPGPDDGMSRRYTHSGKFLHRDRMSGATQRR